MDLVLIAGVARNGVIGGDNRLLWHLPEDMRHFRSATLGCPVIMGRRTWDSLPERFRPLPGRHNIVLTRQPGWHAAGASVAASLDEAIELARKPQPDAAEGQAPARAFVIGGEQIYRQAMERADELLLTEIDHDFVGDAVFPPVDRQRFQEVGRVAQRAAPPNDFDFAFVTYRRVAVNRH